MAESGGMMLVLGCEEEVILPPYSVTSLSG